MQDFNPSDLDQSMSTFEAAVSAEDIRIPPVRLSNLLMAIDGSNQDPTTIRLARNLASTYNAGMHFALAGGEHSRLDPSLAPPGASLVTGRGGSPAMRILDAARIASADLVVTCAPFMEDYDELGTATLGTIVDVVLNKREHPVLVTRRPLGDAADTAMNRLVVPLSLASERNLGAVAWAKFLAQPESAVELLAVADPEVADSMRHTFKSGDQRLEDLDEDRLAGLVRPDIAGIVGAMQRAAEERDFTCRVVVRAGPLVPALLEYANQDAAILLATCTTDCASTGYQRVQALVRGSRNPVLIV